MRWLYDPKRVSAGQLVEESDSEDDMPPLFDDGPSSGDVSPDQKAGETAVKSEGHVVATEVRPPTASMCGTCPPSPPCSPPPSGAEAAKPSEARVSAASLRELLADDAGRGD